MLTEVEFRGRVNVGLAEIEEKTGLKKGCRSDVFRIVESLDDIRKLYRIKGYEQTEVKLAEGSKLGDPRVIIEITEGPKFVKTTLPAPTSPAPAATNASNPQAFGSRGIFDPESSPSIGDAEGPFSRKKSDPQALRDSRVSPAALPPFEVTGPVREFSSPAASVSPTRLAEYNTHLKRADLARRSNQWWRALEEVTAAVRLFPEFADIFRYRSEIYGSMRLYRRAIADLTEAIRIGQHDPNYYLARGHYYCQDRDFDRGFADFDTAFALSFTNEARATAHHWRGSARTLRGDYARAVADYDRAIDLAQDSAEIFGARGQALAREGRHDEAIVDYDRVIAIHPVATLWNLRAESWFALGEFDLALADYQKALEAEPTNEWYRVGRGWGLLARGRLDEAISDFTLTIEGRKANSSKGFAFGSQHHGSRSENHRAYTGRGWAYLAKRDWKRASADFEKAISIQQFGILWFEYGFDARLSLQPRYDRAVDKFYERCHESPSLPWALIVMEGQDARSQFLDNPYFDAYLIGRTRRDAALAPNLIFRVVADWRTFPEAKSAYLGRAIVAVSESDWWKASDLLDSAVSSLVESWNPGVLRPKAAELFP